MAELQLTIEAQFAQAQAELEKLSGSVADLEKATESTETQNKSFSESFTELQSKLATVQQVLGTLKQVYDATAGVFIDYAASVRDITSATGLETEEVSRMIEAADDAGVSVGSLKMALREMGKDGVAPTTEELANLADQFKTIDDPAQKTKFLMEAFGRSGLEMGKLMEQSGESIRATSAIIDKDMAKSARDAEIAFDALDDAVRDIKLTIGAQLIPTLTEAAKALELIVTWNKRIRTALDDTAKNIKNTATSYGEYVAGMEHAANAAGLLVDAQGNLIDIDGRLVQANYLVSESLFDATGQAGKWQDIAGSAEVPTKKLTDAAVALGQGMRAPTDMLNESARVLAYQTQLTKDAAAAEQALAETKNNAAFVWRTATEALQASNIELATQKQLQDALALASGDTTQKQLDQQNAITSLTGVLQNGKITQEEYIELVRQLANNTLSAADAVSILQSNISKLQDKDVYIRIHYQKFGDEEFGGWEPPGGVMPAEPTEPLDAGRAIP